MTRPLYLDHNAGSPLRPEALEAMLPWLKRGAANAGSQHRGGQAAHAALEGAREAAAQALGGWPEEWLFTGGATEACNLAIFGACLQGRGRPLLYGATEHPAVTECARALAGLGTSVEALAVDGQGVLDLSALGAALKRHPGALLALMHANNETGVVHPLAEAAAKVHAAGGLLFSDLSQSAGKLPVNVRDLGLDLAAASGAKFGGPQGRGLLWRRKGLALAPRLFGGHQEQGLRPGTEDVAGALGLGAALSAACDGLARQHKAWATAVEVLTEGLLKRWPSARVHGQGAFRVSNTLSISLPGIERDVLLIRLDQAGLQASAGAACASGANQPSPVLTAMGASPEALASALRFSFGPGQGEQEAQEALRILDLCLPPAP